MVARSLKTLIITDGADNKTLVIKDTKKPPKSYILSYFEKNKNLVRKLSLKISPVIKLLKLLC